MGKFWDFVLSDTWEEFQRIQLFKKIGNSPLVNGNQNITPEGKIVEGERTTPTIEEMEGERVKRFNKITKKK